MPSQHFITQTVDKYCVVEFRTPSLMDPIELEQIGQSLYTLIDEQDRRMMILDFEQVQYISSQAIGILLTINRKITALKHHRLVLVGINERLMELLKITRLDKILTIKPSQKEAVKLLPT